MKTALPETPPQVVGRVPRLALLGLVLAIIGAKLWLINSFSSPLPFLDQWRSEGRELLQPWLHGQFQWADLIKPSNEHRILPTRVLVLGLFEVNAQQWDAQVQMLAGALLHGACAFLLGVVLLRWFGQARAPVLYGALFLLFGLPFGWQNTLWGFQSQFYFLIFFTLLSFWGLALHAPLSAGWWLGAAAGLAACLSMGSGGFAGLALAAAIGVKMVVRPGIWHSSRIWLTAAIAVLLAAIGFALFTRAEGELLASFHRPSVGGFLHSFALRLSWPNVFSPLFALLAYGPFVALFWWHFRQRRAPGKGAEPTPEDFLFPFGFWVILQAAALAYSRNHVVTSIISRYMDLLAPGVLVNFCCLWRLLELTALERTETRSRWTNPALLGGWAVVVLIGLGPITQRNLRSDLPGLLRINEAQVLALRKFFATDETKTLGGKATFGVPESEMEPLANLLRDPAIHASLPVGLGVRTTEPAPGVLTATVRILADAHQLVFGGGVLVLSLGLMTERARRRKTELRTGPGTEPALEE